MARRNFRERIDIMANMTNMELIERYRLDQQSIDMLTNELAPMISPRTARNQSLSALMKVLITLRFYATGSIQLNYGDLHGISQPTVSRVITEVTDALCQPIFINRYISFPQTRQEIFNINQQFLGIGRFPNVIGVIDGTHIEIQAPTQEEELYVNRMNYHSINTQVVFDGHYRILDIVANWPGSTHDSRVLRNSGLYGLLDPQANPLYQNQYLLGDSGYPCKRWLLTPYLHPTQGAQENYNRSHKRTRCLVERGIGQLKRRFGVLHQKIRLNPIKTCKVITACGILHNLCKLRNIPILQEEEVRNQPEDVHEFQYNGPQEGLRYRDHIANMYF